MGRCRSRGTNLPLTLFLDLSKQLFQLNYCNRIDRFVGDEKTKSSVSLLGSISLCVHRIGTGIGIG
jgi:hypothetical protein